MARETKLVSFGEESPGETWGLWFNPYPDGSYADEVELTRKQVEELRDAMTTALDGSDAN